MSKAIPDPISRLRATDISSLLQDLSETDEALVNGGGNHQVKRDGRSIYISSGDPDSGNYSFAYSGTYGDDNDKGRLPHTPHGRGFHWFGGVPWHMGPIVH